MDVSVQENLLTKTFSLRDIFRNILSLQKKFEEGSLFFLATVDKVKFRHQVRPGDTVRMEVTNLRATPHMVKQAGKAYVGETLCAEAEWMCLVGSADSAK